MKPSKTAVVTSPSSVTSPTGHRGERTKEPLGRLASLRRIVRPDEQRQLGDRHAGRRVERNLSVDEAEDLGHGHAGLLLELLERRAVERVVAQRADLLADAGAHEGHEGEGIRGNEVEQIGRVLLRGAEQLVGALAAHHARELGAVVPGLGPGAGEVELVKAEHPQRLRLGAAAEGLERGRDVDIDTAERVVRQLRHALLEGLVVRERLAALGLERRIDRRLLVGDGDPVVDSPRDQRIVGLLLLDALDQLQRLVDVVGPQEGDDLDVGHRARVDGDRRVASERLVSLLPGDVAAGLDLLLQLGQPLLAVGEPEDELLDLLPLVGLGIAVEIGVDQGARLEELRAG